MMPVNTPKVLVRPAGQRQYEWVDLWEAYVSGARLFEKLHHCRRFPPQVCVCVSYCGSGYFFNCRVQTMQKVVFIREAISEEVANNMIALTLYLDSLDNKRIYYWLNVPGGDVVPTLALYDTMQYVRSKTATVCYGLCLGMGGFLLTAGGEKVRQTGAEGHSSDGQRVCRSPHDGRCVLPSLAGLPVRNAPFNPDDAPPKRCFSRPGV